MYIPTAREQKRLGTIGVKQDGYYFAYLTIRLLALVFYERIVNEAQPS